MKKKFFVCIILAFIITILLLFYVIINTNNNMGFDIDKWNSKYEERYKMLSSLTSQYDLIGMNRDNIIELLGTNGIYTNNDSAIEYYVSRGLGDAMFFGIYFNQHGIVESYKSFEN